MSSKPFADKTAVTLESLLEEMVNCDSVARWPDPFYTCVQASSMDRRRKGPDQPDWFVKSSENFETGLCRHHLLVCIPRRDFKCRPDAGGRNAASTEHYENGTMKAATDARAGSAVWVLD